MQKPKFQNGNFYHICNRGVDKRKVFMDKDDYVRFLISLRYFNDKKPIGGIHKYKKSQTFERSKDLSKVVDIISYCLNPNHFHLLLMQRENKGVSQFMQKLSNSYTQYFNTRHKRSGALFQGKYKAFEINSTGKFYEASFYVNGNAEIHGIEKCDKWEWSSCPDYLNQRNGHLCDKNIVLKEFYSIIDYQESLFDYIREKKAWKEEIKKYE